MAFGLNNESSTQDVSTHGSSQGFTGPATCPHCEHVGPVLPDFGLREVNGKIVRQSWCSRCRSRHSRWRQYYESMGLPIPARCTCRSTQ
ncbi:hypothetical protein [Archangium lansingense]|uniref:Uncharacterized protein n=1 Tax=Archangium lansingense TaxID=2995310 RepID=A0ABT3ZUX3_9BACT|nr:hypothetical protein [Archangium lansinium]MCY1073190.1 hypothetical protein [Archangium lansinium]